MGQANKRIYKSGWIIIDGKLQSNSRELVKMAKTIQGVKVENRNGNIWVKFPAKRPHLSKSTGNAKTLLKLFFLKYTSKTNNVGVCEEKNASIGKHYCAIMIK